MRPKYETRSILLGNQMCKDTAKALIDNAPIDPVKNIEVVIREAVKKRSIDANSYYWMRLGEIAAQAWFAGKQYSADVWHHYARLNIMADTVTTKEGVIISKWLESPDGSVTTVSTTQLDKASFSDYTTAVEAFGASLGVKFSSNREEY